MLIYVDIDGTICSQVDNGDYHNASPIQENINKINKLHQEGHTIIYWTARGMRSQRNLEELFDITYSQLVGWGCLFHSIKMGKPSYDLMICDKAKRIEEI